MLLTTTKIYIDYKDDLNKQPLISKLIRATPSSCRTNYTYKPIRCDVLECFKKMSFRRSSDSKPTLNIMFLISPEKKIERFDIRRTTGTRNYRI